MYQLALQSCFTLVPHKTEQFSLISEPGRKEGREEGRKEGRKEDGRKGGREEGRKEGRRKKEGGLTHWSTG